MLVHTVYFWIRDGAPAGERGRLLASCRELLGTIPTVKHFWAGHPAATPKRDVIDASYDVAITVVLDDMAAHDVYQEHPLHKEFIGRHKENWKRVQVYDAEG